MGLVRRWLVVAGAALVVVFGAFAGTAVVTSAVADAEANRAAAQAEVARLLSVIVLPPGMTRSATEPSGDGGVLAFPSVNVATPNLVDAAAWWTTTLSPEAVITYFTAHRPPGTTLIVSGQGSTGLTWKAFAFGGLPGVMSQRGVAVTAVPLAGGGTGVRSDGEAIWVTPRPAWEQIPAGVTSVTLTARGGGRTSSPLTLSGVDAGRLVTFVNGLDVVQPGVRNCPLARNETIRLSFRSASGGVLAEATEHSSGCASVDLSIGGRSGPALTDYPSVASELLRIGAIPMCPGSGLRAVRRTVTGGMLVTFTNVANGFCRVRGTPRIQLFDTAGRRVTVPVKRERASSEIPLSPGDSAMSTVGAIACGRIGRVTLGLPGIAHVFTFRLRPRRTPCRQPVTVGSLFPEI